MKASKCKLSVKFIVRQEIEKSRRIICASSTSYASCVFSSSGQGFRCLYRGYVSYYSSYASCVSSLFYASYGYLEVNHGALNQMESVDLSSRGAAVSPTVCCGLVLVSDAWAVAARLHILLCSRFVCEGCATSERWVGVFLGEVYV